MVNFLMALPRKSILYLINRKVIGPVPLSPARTFSTGHGCCGCGRYGYGEWRGWSSQCYRSNLICCCDYGRYDIKGYGSVGYGCKRCGGRSDCRLDGIARRGQSSLQGVSVVCRATSNTFPHLFLFRRKTWWADNPKLCNDLCVIWFTSSAALLVSAGATCSSNEMLRARASWRSSSFCNEK